MCGLSLNCVPHKHPSPTSPLLSPPPLPSPLLSPPLPSHLSSPHLPTSPLSPPHLPSCRSSGVKYNRLWYAALALVTLVLFSVALGALVFMGLFYTHPEACLLNKALLGINGTLCFIISLLAISPCIQKCESTLHTHTHTHTHNPA